MKPSPGVPSPESPEILAALRPLLDRAGRLSWWGWMRIEVDGRGRDLLLGERTRIEPGLVVLDWRTAPLARVFLECEEEEEYEVEAGERVLEGTLVHARLVDNRFREPVCERPCEAAWRWTLPTWEPAPEVVLDPHQARVVQTPLDRSLLVLGHAGHGKTTVAIHRLAAHYRPGLRVLVLAPTEGLARVCRLHLDRLGLTEVASLSVDAWVQDLAEARWGEVRLSRDTPAAAIRLKRHRAVQAVLPELLRRRGGRRANRQDLLHLWGDGDLLELLMDASGHALSRGMVQAVLAHTIVQFGRRAEEEWAHVIPERLAAVDALPLDEGTPFQDAGTLDVEDLPVLLELDRLRGGRPLPVWDHIVVDEAQELAPLELALVGRLSRSLTVAGDLHQQVDPTACFGGWELLLEDLDREMSGRVELIASHRCRPEVMAWSLDLLAGQASPHSQGALCCTALASPLHQAVVVGQRLRVLRDRAPRAEVGVICASEDHARQVMAWLEPVVGCHRGLGRGIGVVIPDEVRGLDLDDVVVPDLDPEHWPLSSRRLLHVAATRPRRGLWLCTAGAWSPLAQRMGGQRALPSGAEGRGTA